MNGVKLLELEASDLVDVLHFEFEEYFTFVSEEHVASRSGIRKSVYNNLYGIPFKYEVKTNSQNKSGGQSGYRGGMSASGNPTPSYTDDADFTSLNAVNPFSPRDVQRSENGEEIKPYFPPTEFDPNSAQPFPGIPGPMN